MIGKLIRTLSGPRDREAARINDLARRIRFLEQEHDSLWNRMVELEVERNAHDGTNECQGCKSAHAELTIEQDEDSVVINMEEPPRCAVHTFVTTDICGCK